MAGEEGQGFAESAFHIALFLLDQLLCCFLENRDNLIVDILQLFESVSK